ncbi:hypothetical protein, partial [Staphylococcus aureus]|uniref:hypothetical protein n=1 Tax=Staphylococcus aureus TaxID=1280 RepID=UPI001C0FAAA1
QRLRVVVVVVVLCANGNRIRRNKRLIHAEHVVEIINIYIREESNDNILHPSSQYTHTQYYIEVTTSARSTVHVLYEPHNSHTNVQQTRTQAEHKHNTHTMY